MSDEEHFPEDFKCGICTEIPEGVVEAPCCSAVYCLVCISKWVEDHCTCPHCHENVAVDSFKGVRSVQRMIDNLPCECANKPVGCTGMLTRGILKAHLDKGCDFRKVACGLKCDAEMFAKDLDEHEKNYCPNRLVPCPNQCDIANLISVDVEEHLQDECPNRVVECPNVCGAQQLLACKVDEHLGRECPREKVDCPFKASLGCNERIERRGMPKHTESLKGLQIHVLKSAVKICSMTNDMKALQQELVESKADANRKFTAVYNELHTTVEELRLIKEKQKGVVLSLESAVAKDGTTFDDKTEVTVKKAGIYQVNTIVCSSFDTSAGCMWLYLNQDGSDDFYRACQGHIQCNFRVNLKINSRVKVGCNFDIDTNSWENNLLIQKVIARGRLLEYHNSTVALF